MDRYEFKRVFYSLRRDGRGGSDMKLLLSKNGAWVKYSDVEATERRLIEVEDMASFYQQQHQQLANEREALQARVRELEGLLERTTAFLYPNPVYPREIPAQLRHEVYRALGLPNVFDKQPKGTNDQRNEMEGRDG